MTKPRGVEAKLKRLQALAKETVSAQTIEELRRSLKDASNLVATEAADIVGDKHIAELAPDLLAAVERFLVNPSETDKGCRAKFAAITALHKLDYDKPDIFLRGIKYQQKEWRFGEPKPEDTAAELRGQCAFALVRLGHPDILLLLADLLADEEKQSRAAAAQALAATGSIAAIPLLRFKLRIHDAEPDVMQECFTALIKLDSVESGPFVIGFLEDRDAGVQEAAALALGESRQTSAFAPLKHFCERQARNPEVACLALALSRLPQAIDHLLEIVAYTPAGRGLSAKENPTSSTSLPLAALSALAIHRHNASLRTRITEAVAKNTDPAVKKWFEKKFSAGD